MAYRTPEQDQELAQLHEQREAVQDYGIKNKVDVSQALAGLDAEIWMLTEFLEPVRDMFDDLSHEERKAFELLLAVTDEWADNQHAAAIEVAQWRLSLSVSEKNLNDMTPGEQAQWFAGASMVEF